MGNEIGSLDKKIGLGGTNNVLFGVTLTELFQLYHKGNEQVLNQENSKFSLGLRSKDTKTLIKDKWDSD